MSEPYVAELGEEVTYYPIFNKPYPWKGKVVAVHSIREIGEGQYFAPSTRFCRVDIKVPNPDGSTSLIKDLDFTMTGAANSCAATRWATEAEERNNRIWAEIARLEAE